MKSKIVAVVGPYMSWMLFCEKFPDAAVNRIHSHVTLGDLQFRWIGRPERVYGLLLHGYIQLDGVDAKLLAIVKDRVQVQPEVKA